MYIEEAGGRGQGVRRWALWVSVGDTNRRLLRHRYRPECEPVAVILST